MEAEEREESSTRRPPALEPVTMVVVADDVCTRLAIQRSLPRCAFVFASDAEEAEALTRAGVASRFYFF